MSSHTYPVIASGAIVYASDFDAAKLTVFHHQFDGFLAFQEPAYRRIYKRKCIQLPDKRDD
jgi:hypothetical protein